MATDKKRVSTYLADDEVRMLDAIVDLLHLNPQNGRSEAIEAALKFYFAYLSNQMNTDYLCGIYEFLEKKKMDSLQELEKK